MKLSLFFCLMLTSFTAGAAPLCSEQVRDIVQDRSVSISKMIDGLLPDVTTEACLQLGKLSILMMELQNKIVIHCETDDFERIQVGTHTLLDLLVEGSGNPDASTFDRFCASEDGALMNRGDVPYRDEEGASLTLKAWRDLTNAVQERMGLLFSDRQVPLKSKY